LKRIGNLELHVAHGCNFTCEGCSHYSDQHHKGMLGLEECARWLAPWAGRIAPQRLSLLGGEPTLHPRLAEFVPLARRHFPRAQLRIVTNGFLLHRHPGLPHALLAHGNAHLYVSIHHDAPEYIEKLKPVEKLLLGWEKQGVKVSYYASFEYWTRRYHGIGAQMQPFEDNRPRESWEACTARHCPQIFEGRIWKCGPLAYLGMQDAKYGLSEKWTPYLSYKPLEPGCSDAELTEFFAREEESQCAMCPAAPEKFKLPVPIPVRRAAAAQPAQ
jgi:hypothetical protein